MMTKDQREQALGQMRAAVQTFYYQAVQIGSHPFIEFAGVMTAYVKTCERAHAQGTDSTDCNRHCGPPLPMESFEIAYLAEKRDCIFDGRIVARDPISEGPHNLKEAMPAG